MMRYKILLLLMMLVSGNQLHAQITASDTVGCAPLSQVQFTSPAGATNINWDFDDGATASIENPIHTFTSPGIYTVQYTSVIAGNNVSESLTIRVLGKPSPGFYATSPTSGCVGLTVTFLDSSFGGGGSAITLREWAFGDGGVNVGNDANPSYTFNLPGTFDVSLKVTDINGCDSAFVRPVYVNTSIPPTVVLASSPNPVSACVPPLAVTFTGSGSHVNAGATSLTHLWHFGTGDSSTVADPPVYTYNDTGNFVVTLTVTDNNGCSNDTNVLASIKEPVASFFAVGAINDTVCKTVTFRNESSAGFYTYNYGDATTGTDSVHTYAAAGTYNVTLQVQAGNCIDDTTITIIVEDVQAQFTSTPDYSCSYPSIITYTNTSVNAVSYEWIFYDATSSTLSNPIDTILQPEFNQYTIYELEVYTTVLIATSVHGCQDFYAQGDSVFKPTGLLAASVAYGCAPLTVQFDDSSHSNEPIIFRDYYFGDGGSETGTNNTSTSHTYTAPGIYHPYIVITNSLGCVDTSYTLTIYVGEPPTPNFSVSPTTVCVHDSVEFTDLTPPSDSAHWIHFNADGGMMSHCYNDHNPSWAFNNVTGPQNITMYGSYNGCVDSTTLTNVITVNGPLVHFYPVNDCANPFVYLFTGTVSGATDWLWDFGDGQTLSTTTDVTPSHTYAATGDYNVLLIGYNPSTGCQPDSEMHTIHVRDIEAIFSPDTIVCVNSTTVFNGGASKDVNATCNEGYLWYWNDGTHPHNSEDSITTHSFANGGIYPVWLIVTDINGCKDTAQQIVNAFDIVPGFSVDKTYGCLPLTINFTDTSTADTTITQWFWTFGDGSTSTLQNPTHTYTTIPSAGRFLVTLTVRDTLGCNEQRTLFITPSIPDSLFTAISTTGICAGDSVHFQPFGPGPGYMWYFGDGDSSSQQIPWHTFVNGGSYDITLVVTDSIGCKGSRTVSSYVTVHDFPIAGFVSTADTAFSRCYPLLVNYTDTSNNVSPGPRIWDLGNGSQVITAQTVGTIYQAPGDYTVSLIVQTTFGCRDTIVKTLSVEGPVGDFDIFPTTICKGQSVTLTIRDTSDIGSYLWDFGDGTDTIGVSPVTHTFNINPASGQTTIGLVMLSPDSTCAATQTNILNIYPVIADFELANDDTTLCLYASSAVTNLSQNVTSYSWNFGNGNTFTGVNPPPVSYNSTGLFNITLTVNDNVTGCSDTKVQEVIVNALPQVVATGGDTCQGFSVQLSASGGDSYLWQPATGLNDNTISNPIASPASTTTYTVQVTDVNDCTSSGTAQVVIYQPPPEIHTDTTIVIGSPVVIGYELPDPGYIYAWDPVTYLSCSNCPTPMSHVLEDIIYDFTVTDGEGCFIVTSTYEFFIRPVTSIDVPTAFTPDGDDHNDRIFVNGWGIKELIDFKIYNRWGQLVYESSDITEGWDGYFQGELQPQDTYVYQAEVETWIDGQRLQKKGMFELIR